MPKEKEEKEIEKPKEKERFEVAEVTTQTAPAIRDNIDEKYYDVVSCLCMLCNKIDKIERAVV